MQYNGMLIPSFVRSERIISAFENVIDSQKVEEFKDAMICGEQFPPITGYPDVIDEDDVGKVFMDGSEVVKSDVGQSVWYVTDGHHRTIAAIEAGICRLNVMMDMSCFTDEDELLKYRKYLQDVTDGININI